MYLHSDVEMTLPQVDSPHAEAPYRIVVVGGAYGGISTILTLIDLIDGKPLRTGMEPRFSSGLRTPRRLEVVLLDQRDGFCKQ